MGVSATFVNSLYQLFYENHGESHGFQPNILTPMTSRSLSEGRAIASSSSQPFLTLNLSCENNTQQETSANKIRLTGKLCGVSPQTLSEKGVRATIANSTNQFIATVFTHLPSGAYSTDYIPLNTGRNEIHITFSYTDENKISQDLIVNKL